MKSRAPYSAMPMPEGDHDKDDMGPWANRWDLNPSPTGAPQVTHTRVEQPEEAASSRDADDSEYNGRRAEFS